MENIDSATIDYRLDNIEKTLAELKNVMIETRLQEKDIKELYEKQKELLQAINSHDHRIKELEVKPDKESAGRWKYIVDFIFKGIVATVVGYLFIKLGLS